MFKRILNALFSGLIAATLASCMADPNAPVKVQNGGGGDRTDSFGKFPTKPVAVDPLDDNAQMMAAFTELARVQRSTINSVKPPKHDSRAGCIAYRVPPGKTGQFLTAKYNCLKDEVRKKSSPMVREEHGLEKYTGSRWITNITGTWMTVSRLKADPKNDLTGGDIARSLTLVYLQHDSDALTVDYTATARPSIRARKSGPSGEIFKTKIERQSLDTPNMKTIEFDRGFTFFTTYEVDPMVTKAPQRKTVFTAMTPIEFPEACPFPSGTFSFEISTSGTVIKSGTVVLTAAGFQIQEPGSSVVEWPKTCLDI